MPWKLDVGSIVQVIVPAIMEDVIFTEYGGMGLDYTYGVAMNEALGHTNCGGIPMAIAVQTDVSTPALARWVQILGGVLLWMGTHPKIKCINSCNAQQLFIFWEMDQGFPVASVSTTNS